MSVLTRIQQETIRNLVKGKVVWDLGAGDLGHAKTLIKLGARKVVAVDKEAKPEVSPTLEVRRLYLQDVTEISFDTIFVSWPVNWEIGLLSLLRRASTIIYLGKNTDGTACGTPSMFKYLLCREVLAHVPDRRNTLICYGCRAVAARTPFQEELAAIDNREIVHYTESECESTVKGVRHARARR